MTIKITTPNGGSDSLDFGCAQTPVVATVTGTEVSSGEGKLELKTTTGGTSATKVTVLANGQVGIGTTAPAAKINVASGDGATAVNQAILSGGRSLGAGAVGGAGALLFTNSYWDANKGAALISGVDSGSSGGELTFSTTTNGGGTTGVPTERMRIDNAGNLKFNSGYGSAATAYGCRAWVNFNGTGTVAIRASGNVSSISDNGVGDYSMNFTVAMVDANYSICGSTVGTQSTYYNHIFGSGSSVLTTGSTRFRTANSTNPSQPQDSDFNHVVIIR